MKTVWVNGCFDVLHRGHAELFKYAKSMGDRLIVGIDSDDKVGRDKGDGRPVNCAEDRKLLLESIRYIDDVFVFNSKEELENLIKELKPDIMVVGSDWRNKSVVGQEYAGKLLFFERIGDHSTTKILSRRG